MKLNYLSIFFVFVLAGCSSLYDNTVGLFFDAEPSQQLEPAPPRTTPQQQVTPPTSSVQIEQVPDTPDQAEPIDEIEIIWEIPQQKVDGFVLKYGYSPENLTFEKRLRLEEIERYAHPQFGPVFRFLLHGIPSNEKLFVAMATIEGDTISELSEVFEVAAKSVE